MRTHVVLLSATAAMTQVATAALHYSFSGSSFNTISGPGGSGTASNSGAFTLAKGDGTILWSDDLINNKSPCFNNKAGSRIEVLSACWDGPITIHCKSSGAAIPEKCSADYVGNHFEGGSDGGTDFFGAGISLAGTCKGGVVVDIAECTKDNANIHFNYPTKGKPGN